MIDPSHQQLKSPNFVFLRKHDPILVRYAALAERYVFEDPNTALIKLRQFAETLAEMSAAYAGISLEPNAALTEILNRLWDRRIVNEKISQLFHSLRKTGNRAVHAHEDEHREALNQLKLARQLAVWFLSLRPTTRRLTPAVTIDVLFCEPPVVGWAAAVCHWFGSSIS